MHPIPSSYKDPSGFIFLQDDLYYRAIHKSYEEHYEKLMSSGLYENLVQKKLLIPHQEVAQQEVHRVVLPQQIWPISYAYEWSFTMWKDAALCTLDNAIEGLKFDMMLKDANTFNIQFVHGKPILIDTLSFERYTEGEAWIAYMQFCTCFLGPLFLMKYTHYSAHLLLVQYPNGIPLEICNALLPFGAKCNLHVFLHIVLPSRMQKKQASASQKMHGMSKQKLAHLLHGLKSCIQQLHIKKTKSTWDDYYDATILSEHYLQEKKDIASAMLATISFERILDMGTNKGEFAILYQQQAKQIIATDFDANCIESLYTYCKAKGYTNILPLIIDSTNPSPSIGWNNTERPSFLQRISADITFALALIHHLAIANNIPLQQIVQLFHSMSRYVLIEFVPKSDPKVKALLQYRKDIFDKYTLESFKQEVAKLFVVLQEKQITNTDRVLFLLERKP